MGARLTAGQRTLTPPVEVRILCPQPFQKDSTKRARGKIPDAASPHERQAAPVFKGPALSRSQHDPGSGRSIQFQPCDKTGLSFYGIDGGAFR